MHCFFLERDLSCGLFCIQGVLLTSLSHASCFACLFLGEHACFHRVHLITLQAYASLTPIVHIVNVQNAGKESHANITVCSIPKLFDLLSPIKNLEKFSFILVLSS
jgi:hypothetical protein